MQRAGYSGDTPNWFPRTADHDQFYGDPFEPSSRWDHGGPIIEHEHIRIEFDIDIGKWIGWAPISTDNEGMTTYTRLVGPTPLVAAMRAFVARGKHYPQLKVVPP